MPWGTQSRRGIEAGGYLQSPGTATCVLGTARNQGPPTDSAALRCPLTDQETQAWSGEAQATQGVADPQGEAGAGPWVATHFCHSLAEGIGPATQSLFSCLSNGLVMAPPSQGHCEKSV